MKDPEKKKYLYMMLAGFGAISLSVAFFFLLYRLQGVQQMFGKIAEILMPFVYGGVIAYLLCPLCNWFSHRFHKWLPAKLGTLAEGLAIACALLVGLLAVYLLIIMIAPQLVASIMTLWNNVPDMVNKLIEWFTENFGENQALINYLNSAYTTMYERMDKWFENVSNITNLLSGLGSGVSKVFSFFKNLLLGLIVAVYFLGSRKLFARQSVMLVRSMLPVKWADFVLDEVKLIDEMFAGFIDGKLVDSAIIGVLCYIGCLVFRFPNALVIGAIVGLTNIIPFFGPFLGAIPSTLLILIEDPIKALWFILFVLVLQQLDGNVIGPKILGSHTGVSSFWVMFAILLFGGLWGIVGMVVAVPLFAVIYDLVRRLVHRGLKFHGYSPKTGEKPENPEN